MIQPSSSTLICGKLPDPSELRLGFQSELMRHSHMSIDQVWRAIIYSFRSHLGAKLRELLVKSTDKAFLSGYFPRPAGILAIKVLATTTCCLCLWMGYWNKWLVCWISLQPVLFHFLLGRKKAMWSSLMTSWVKSSLLSSSSARATAWVNLVVTQVERKDVSGSLTGPRSGSHTKIILWVQKHFSTLEIFSSIFTKLISFSN